MYVQISDEGGLSPSLIFTYARVKVTKYVLYIVPNALSYPWSISKSYYVSFYMTNEKSTLFEKLRTVFLMKFQSSWLLWFNAIAVFETQWKPKLWWKIPYVNKDTWTYTICWYACQGCCTPCPWNNRFCLWDFLPGEFIEWN